MQQLRIRSEGETPGLFSEGRHGHLSPELHHHAEIQPCGPIRRVQEFLKINNDFDMSAKGINDALLRIGESSMAEYSRIQDRIRRSRWVHIDETGFHVEAKKYWLWSFRSAKNDVLVVFIDSRGRAVVKETTGGGFPWSRNSGRLKGMSMFVEMDKILRIEL